MSLNEPQIRTLKAWLTDCLANYFAIDPQVLFDGVHVEQQQVTIFLPFVIGDDDDKLIDYIKSQDVHHSLSNVTLSVSSRITSAVTKLARVPNIKNIIAIASGKGGVGKSTTAINLAYALQHEGARVGILDADIYGPSIPIMLGNPDATPHSQDQRHMEPLEAHGIVANSIGYLVPSDKATIWRGPMVSRALQQLLTETYWPELDYLIVDMPPGTGDIQLTLAQQVPVSAAVVVTTPQDLALADAVKAMAMFNKVDVPVLGVVENMSYYQCKHCGTKEYIFAAHGGQKLAKDRQVPLLGELPLDMLVREHADGGYPLLVGEPSHPISNAYRDMAKAVSRALAAQVPADQTTIPVVNKC